MRCVGVAPKVSYIRQSLVLPLIEIAGVASPPCNHRSMGPLGARLAVCPVDPHPSCQKCGLGFQAQWPVQWGPGEPPRMGLRVALCLKAFRPEVPSAF